MLRNYKYSFFSETIIMAFDKEKGHFDQFVPFFFRVYTNSEEQTWNPFQSSNWGQ